MTLTSANPFEDPAPIVPVAPASVTMAAPDSFAAATLTVDRSVSLTLGTDALIVLDESLDDAENALCCGLVPRRKLPASRPSFRAGKTGADDAAQLDEAFPGSPSSSLPAAKPTTSIPFYNVLWAELTDREITIHYARPTSSTVVRVAYLNYTIEKAERSFAESWVSTLLEKAYGKAQRRKRIKVLINPFGGTGGAVKIWARDIEPIFAAAKCELDAEHTQRSGHAVEIAEKLDVDAWDVIASCSGDGLPHEVFNGLGRKPDATKALEKIAVVQLPCGSGNAMSLNLNGTSSPSLAALAIVKGIRTPLDLVSLTQGDRRTLSFLSQSLGIIAECDLGTENLRWLGSARFTVGVLARLIAKAAYPCDIAVGVEIEDKVSIREAYKRELEHPSPVEQHRTNYDGAGLPPLRYGTVNDPLPPSWELKAYDSIGNFYCGNMAYMSSDVNFFPASLPADGCNDLVCINADISRVESIKIMLAAETGAAFDLDSVSYRKISGYRIIPKAQGRNKNMDGYISVDGERIPFEPFQAEIHRGLGTVLSKNGNVYEAKGV